MRQFAEFALAALVALGSAQSFAAEEGHRVDLFDPSNPDAERAFVVINDGVMGGVSTSRVRVIDGSLVFEGTVRLENNGGFASMRASTGTTDLSSWTGIEIVVRGDGQRYKLNLRDDGRFDSVSHRVSFETSEGETQTLRFPFADFEPTFRGRRVPDAGRLDPSRIRQVGFLISDKQAGEFRLEILAFRAYRGDS